MGNKNNKMNKITLFLLLSILISCNSERNIQYPITEKIIVTDTYFTTKVEDPYRWLEDDTSLKVRQWVEDQNKLTFSYFEKIPQRENIKNRLEDLWNYEKIGTPFTEGEYTYFYKNDGLQNQYVLYRKKGEEKESVFISQSDFVLFKDSTFWFSRVLIPRLKYCGILFIPYGAIYEDLFLNKFDFLIIFLVSNS